MQLVTVAHVGAPVDVPKQYDTPLEVAPPDDPPLGVPPLDDPPLGPAPPDEPPFEVAPPGDPPPDTALLQLPAGHVVPQSPTLCSSFRRTTHAFSSLLATARLHGANRSG